jgi:hypothetical protein
VRREQKRAQAFCHQNRTAASAYGTEGTSREARSGAMAGVPKWLHSKTLATQWRFGYEKNH